MQSFATPAAARQQRHEAILRLVGSRTIRNQADLAGLLAAEGLHATQATLSRDLRELGVVKGGDGYALPGPVVLDDLTRACQEWLLTAESVAHQVVLRTPPGGAQPMAIALDAAGESGVAGTIAGDDTVLVVCRSARAATALSRALGARIPSR